MNNKRCPHCPCIVLETAAICPECGLQFNGQPKQFSDGELRVSKPWRTEVCLTFVRTENLDSGYGVSKIFLKKEITKLVIASFLNHARTLL
ncbi:hypothetical protein CSW98_15960 [Vibrio sp. HA2012]|nr:hypothetical protein CSW98_15960 [Vibrio sp. HA2012]